MSVLPADEYAGHLSITWPRSNGAPVLGSMVAVTDGSTGEPITSVVTMVVTVNVSGLVTADMTMLTDDDGLPLLGTGITPIKVGDSDDAYRTGQFRWLVTEMRVAE